MTDVNLLAILVATVAAFALSGAYYATLGQQLAQLSDAAAAGGQMPAWKVGAELLRSLVLVAVVAGLAAQGEVDDFAAGAVLGLVLWIGFPLVLWTGAIVHENTPFGLAAIHAGDWLVKLPVVAMIVAAW